MESTIVPGVHAVFVHCSDLRVSAKWYCELLELPYDETAVHSPIFNVPVREGVFLTLDDHAFDDTAELVPTNQPTFNLFAHSLYQSYEWVKEKEIQIVREIEHHENFGWFIIEDPDRNRLMICGNLEAA
ncbi:hypothetical protein N781_07135 [Pontibacillus halophilus JSM 076056 = DSM 19796]|uniref:Glyoxalase/fosfomycin resistance/dioxygenase domain-containing protein n=1 Tax=Pontibacillus halophilus JSM 076056 = DSM 19796 TaxID=1385510 RepID=A0A0A5I416_9BACI|nr:VOC family protein [Pontibacillus halophilus]KGX90557.1 hypothetical protein N781_07135 [Pontibacillus halophilus JSM 076056 = DSM 19796]